MEFGFTEAEERWRQELREFYAREIKPGFVERLCREQGCENPHSQDLYLKMAQKGWLGLSWPKKYGGQARSHIEQAIFSEEAIRGGVPAGTMNVIGNSVHFLGGLLLAFGTEEQKGRWLPLITQGKLRSCQGLSEPNAGSDLAAVELRAVEEEDCYVLNGTKIFNNAHNATHIFTVSRTNTNVAKHKGISLFLTDLSIPGVTISALITCGGVRRNEVSFQDARITKDSLIGQKDRGWYHLAASMGFERSQAAGMAELSLTLDEAIEYAKSVKRDGQFVGQFPSVRRALAELATEMQIGWLLSYWVVWLQSQGRDVSTREAPMAKLYRSEVQEHFAKELMSVLGESGQLEGDDAPLRGRIARMYRDSRTGQIAAGTSEIQRNIIALRGLGLPAEQRARAET